MSVVLGVDAVLAFMEAKHPRHDDIVAFFRAVEDDLVTTPLAAALMDQQATSKGGRKAAEALWADFESGAYTVRWWADALDETLEIAKTSTVSLVDASLVALALRLRTRHIATFDRGFEIFSLTLLPERT